jgi:hypothetical protein
MAMRRYLPTDKEEARRWPVSLYDGLAKISCTLATVVSAM